MINLRTKKVEAACQELVHSELGMADGNLVIQSIAQRLTHLNITEYKCTSAEESANCRARFIKLAQSRSCLFALLEKYNNSLIGR